MPDEFSDLLSAHGAVPGRPLLGLTILLVEDSRLASDAMRLICLRAGARLRRADCLRSARRHLQTYLPGVAIVDLGLPDGPGEELIAEIAAAAPGVLALFGTSGDPDLAGRALAAGADAFLPKPVESLQAFQETILRHLPAMAPGHARPALPGDPVEPDPVALRDDLRLAAGLLRGTPDAGTLDYVARFLAGVALNAHDQPLRDAACALASDPVPGLAELAGLVDARLAQVAVT